MRTIHGAWLRTARPLAMALLLAAAASAGPAVAGAQAVGSTPPAGGARVAATTAEEQTTRFFDGIRHDPARTLIFLRDMPKGADLHSHLSGAVYAESYIEWAAADGLCFSLATAGLVAPPCDADNGRPPAAAALQSSTLYNTMIDAMSMRNWNPAMTTGHRQFFDSFGRFVAATRHTALMLAEVADRAARGRVSYLELMVTLDGDASGRLAGQLGWDPDFDRMRDRLLQAGLRDTAELARHNLSGVEARQREVLACATPARRPGCDVEVRYLYQVQRARAPELVFAQILVGFELAALDPRVVGLNLVQPEDHLIAMRDYTLHMQMIAALRRHYPDVKIALHAGELAAGLVPPEQLGFHIRQAVEIAGASRIGHGVSIAHEDDAEGLLREMARRNVLVEIALGSNDAILGITGRQHPLRLYMEYGVPVALATDDEGVLRSDLSLEFARAVEEHALRYPELKQMARNSIAHAFADAATKARLAQDLEAAFAAFEAGYAVHR
jgi:adenosine deaminase